MSLCRQELRKGQQQHRAYLSQMISDTCQLLIANDSATLTFEQIQLGRH